MTDKVQKIREKVERLKSNLVYGACSSQIAMETRCKEEAYNEVLAIINSDKEEPVSEELDEAADCYKDTVTPEEVDDFEHAYFYETYTEYQIADAFKDGAQWQKTMLMTNAIDVTVHIDAGGYPYIPQIELYDYDKDVPLTKEGEKYKVILIKED